MFIYIYIQVPVDAPWTAKYATEWDNITVQQWLDKVCWFRYSDLQVQIVILKSLHDSNLVSLDKY